MEQRFGRSCDGFVLLSVRVGGDFVVTCHRRLKDDGFFGHVQRAGELAMFVEPLPVLLGIRGGSAVADGLVGAGLWAPLRRWDQPVWLPVEDLLSHLGPGEAGFGGP